MQTPKRAISRRLRFLKSFFCSRTLAFVSLIIAIVYGIYIMTLMNPFHFSLSMIGEPHRKKFMTWGGITGLALIFNMSRFYSRIDRNKLMTGLGLFCLVPAIIGLIGLTASYRRDPVHMPMAIVFAVFLFMCILLALLQAVSRSKRYILPALVLLIGLAVDAYFFIIQTHMAMWENFPLLLIFALLLPLNNLSYFDLNSKEARIKAHANKRQAEEKMASELAQ